MGFTAACVEIFVFLKAQIKAKWKNKLDWLMTDVVRWLIWCARRAQYKIKHQIWESPVERLHIIGLKTLLNTKWTPTDVKDNFLNDFFDTF